MNNKISALLLAATLGLASTGVSHACSSLISLSSERMANLLNGGRQLNLSHHRPSAGFAGSVAAGFGFRLDPGCHGHVQSQRPPVSQATNHDQTATMTVWLGGAPAGRYPYTLTGHASTAETIRSPTRLLFSQLRRGRARRFISTDDQQQPWRIRGLARRPNLPDSGHLPSPIQCGWRGLRYCGRQRPIYFFHAVDATASARFLSCGDYSIRKVRYLGSGYHRCRL